MKILVTGGTGLIGESTIRELLKSGHVVRLLSRSAERDGVIWSDGVESRNADVGDPESLSGSTSGCDAVIHIAGIASENPPETTFYQVNVKGTEALIREAEASGIRRFVFVSSLGADRGESEYHRSKRAAEEIVRGFRGSWIILRPGNVYGPGDEVLSFLLQMARTTPVVPVVDLGDQSFQPIWHEDLAKALAAAVEADHLKSEVLEIGGHEIRTANEVLQRFTGLTGRPHVRIPVPGPLASMGAALAGMVGIDVPFDQNKLAMLRETNIIRDPRGNGLDVLGITPTPLDEGLKRLVNAQPEQLPDDGIGPMVEKSFWAQITGSPFDAAELQEQCIQRFHEVMPLEFGGEPGADTELVEGASLTATLPARGNIQIRVQEIVPGRITFGTLAGHPLSGIVGFHFADEADSVIFEVRIYARAANIADFLMMNTVGEPAQNLNWQMVVQRVVELSGGSAISGVNTSTRNLPEEEAETVEKEIRDLVAARKRAENDRKVA